MSKILIILCSIGYIGCDSEHNPSTPGENNSPIRITYGGTNYPYNNNGSFISGTTLKFKAYKNNIAIYANWTADSATPTISYTNEFTTTAVFVPKDSVSRGVELQLIVTAKSDVDSFPKTTLTVTQYNQDGLRQEYLDYYIFLNNIPSFYEFHQDSSSLYPNLVDKPNDVDNWHFWWIVRDLISFVETAESYYYSTYYIYETGGYRCPAGNTRARGVINSKHMYGNAFDWDQGRYPSANRTTENYNVWVAVGNTYPQGRFLYDQHDHLILSVPPSTLPVNLTVRLEDGSTAYNHQVTAYIHGHAEWN